MNPEITSELIENLLRLHKQLEETATDLSQTFGTELLSWLEGVPKRPLRDTADGLREFVSAWRARFRAYQSVFDDFRSAVMVSAYCTIYMHHSSRLGKDIEGVVNKQKQVEAGKEVNPFERYDKVCADFETNISVAHFLTLLHALDVPSLAHVLFARLRPEDSPWPSDSINWIPINKVLLKVGGIEGEVKKFPRSKWFGGESEKVLSKLQEVKRFIFNDQALRTWKKDTKSTMEVDIEPLKDSLECAIMLSTQSLWAQYDLDLDPKYLTPEQLNKHSFKNICLRVLPEYQFIDIAGDGNCFYRAVVRFFFPNVTTSMEEKVSLELRKSLNPLAPLKRKREKEDEEKQNSKKEKIGEEQVSNSPQPSLDAQPPPPAPSFGSPSPQQPPSTHLPTPQPIPLLDPSGVLGEFEEEGISDPTTMQKSGVWADHLQVLKLSGYLEREVWLYRFDDPLLILNEKGELIPGGVHQIRNVTTPSPSPPPSQLPPITLFYIPEVHYEVLRKKQPIRDTKDIMLEIQTCKLVNPDNNLSVYENALLNPSLVANLLVEVVLTVTTEVNAVEELYLLMNQLDIMGQMDVRNQIKQRTSELSKDINILAQLLFQLPSSFLEVIQKDGAKLHSLILQDLFMEKDTSRPLSDLLDRLKYYESNLYATHFYAYDERKTFHFSFTTLPVLTEKTFMTFPQPPQPQSSISMPKPTINQFKTKQTDNLSLNETHPINSYTTTQATWKSKLENLKSYKITSAHNKINPIALKYLFEIASELQLEKVSFRFCNFEEESCKIIKNFKAKGTPPLKFKQCTFRASIE